MNKPKWKNIVKTKVKSFSLNSLKKEAAKLKHVNVDIDTYSELKQQNYLQTLPPRHARCIFQIRTGVIDLRAVRKYWYKDSTGCRLCGRGDENINHVVNICSKILRTSHINHISTNIIDEQQQIADRCIQFAKLVKDNNTGDSVSG